MLFTTPTLSEHDLDVIAEIDAIRGELAQDIRAPKRWTGSLRRATQARAIRGSNSIEGYDVTSQDALAAVDGEAPLSADEKTWKEIKGYRRVLTYVLRMASSPNFHVNTQTLLTMHFMLLEHDFSKSPGEFRPGDIYVQDEHTGQNAYEGPDAEEVPGLVRELADTFALRDDPTLIRAAMAHLNLVMIHPFRDGNGRMARVLQTSILAADDIVQPEFSSIEEWLGAHTDDYYAVLAAVGQGSWNPGSDATLWVRFCLRAHHQQAQILRRRFREATRIWVALDDLVTEVGVPERTTDSLFDAALGMRLQRSSYMNRTALEERTASRDLADLVEVNLLEAHGTTRGRYYVAGSTLLEAVDAARGDRTLSDPYPDLMREILPLSC